MKSAIVEREVGDVTEERRLLAEGLEKFPTAWKVSFLFIIFVWAITLTACFVFRCGSCSGSWRSRRAPWTPREPRTRKDAGGATRAFRCGPRRRRWSNGAASPQSPEQSWNRRERACPRTSGCGSPPSAKNSRRIHRESTRTRSKPRTRCSRRACRSARAAARSGRRRSKPRRGRSERRNPSTR